MPPSGRRYFLPAAANTWCPQALENLRVVLVIRLTLCICSILNLPEFDHLVFEVPQGTEIL
jgi:hypothetical protein